MEPQIEDIGMEPLKRIPAAFKVHTFDECSLLCFEHLGNRCSASWDELFTAQDDFNESSFSRVGLYMLGCFSVFTGECTGVVTIVPEEGYCVSWEGGSGMTKSPIVALSLAINGPRDTAS